MRRGLSEGWREAGGEGEGKEQRGEKGPKTNAAGFFEFLTHFEISCFSRMFSFDARRMVCF